jgi:hypothetical protein
LPSNSLSADSVARLVSAATVEAVFVEVLLVLADVPANITEAWLLLTLPIDIIAPIATAGIKHIGRNSKNLSKIFCGGPLEDTSQGFCALPSRLRIGYVFICQEFPSDT